jgi:NitT/TauT family transport system permease protein
MIRQKIRKESFLLTACVAICLLVAGYSWLSSRQHCFNPKDTTIPNLHQFAEGFDKIVSKDATGHIWLLDDFGATLSRHLGGLFVGSMLALVVGMLMGISPYAEAFFGWPVNFFSKIPPTAMMAVYFVLFGTEYKMFVAMIALGIFPVLAQAIYQSVKNDVPDCFIFKAYTLGASLWEITYNVIFMQILPRIIESVRLQVGPALVFLIAAELLVADVGFGYRLRIQSRLLNMNVVYIYLIVLGVSFIFMDWALRFIRRRTCPWFGE